MKTITESDMRLMNIDAEFISIMTDNIAKAKTRKEMREAIIANKATNVLHKLIMDEIRGCDK